MTQKQEMFCRLTEAGRGPEAAVREAGYAGSPKKTAARLMELPAIAARLAEARLRHVREVAGREEVLDSLTRLLRQEELPLRERIHVLELLGKHYGLFDGSGGGEEPTRIVDDVR